MFKSFLQRNSKKRVYKIWRWKRCVLEGDNIGLYILPLLGVSRENGQWAIWLGWLKWLFTIDLTGGYSFNYLKYEQ